MTRRTPLIRALTGSRRCAPHRHHDVTAPSGNGRKFYDDDPLDREPETQDASGAQEREIDLFYDLAENLFGRPGDSTPNVRARNINTIDEVPDSSWFTNRILARPLSVDEAVRGPLTGTGPATGHLVCRQAQAGRVRAGLHDERCEGGDLVRLVRREGTSRSGNRRDSGRQQDLLGAGLLAGRELPDLGASRSTRRLLIPRR